MTDNKERDAFEVAWSKAYPLHEKTVFTRSLLNPHGYAGTRINDGWKMWQARAALAASQEKAEPVAYVDGDDSLRRILWEPDQAAFNLPVGTKLYAAPVAAQASEPICNLWIDPVTKRYEVDHCTHPTNELIPVYTAPQPSAEAVRDAVRTFWQQHTPSDALSMSLPELHNDVECVIRGHRASAEAVRNAALEEAAVVCSNQAYALDNGGNLYIRYDECLQAAHRIRALKFAPPQPAEQPDDEIDDLFDRSGWVPVDEPGGLHFTAHNLIKPAAPAPSASPAVLTAGQMQSLERVEYFLKAWEWGGVGPSVAQVSDSPDSYVVLTLSDLRTALALARAQGEQA